MKEHINEIKPIEQLEKSTEQVGSLKKETLCKSKLPHRYALVLPDYMQSKNYGVSQEAIDKYYESEDRVAKVREEEEKFVKALGIVTSTWNRKPTRHYQCVVCSKKAINIYE